MLDSHFPLTILSFAVLSLSSVQSASPVYAASPVQSASLDHSDQPSHREGVLKVCAELSSTIISADEKTKPYPLSLIADGDLATYFWSGTELKKGDTISITFKDVVPVGKRVKVTTGFGVKNEEDGDHLQDGVLESSKDQGKSWLVVGTFHAGRAEAKMAFPSRHFRVRVTKSMAHWVAFREIEVSDSPLTQVTVRDTATLNGKSVKLSVTTDLEGMEALRPRFKEMAALYFSVWPKLVTWLGVPADEIPRDIDIIFAKSLLHPAHAGNHTMTMDSRHLQNHPKDTEGVFVHELGHIVQHYSTYEPSWFVEGSADYVRFRQYPDRKWAQGHRKRMTNKKPFGFYWDSASFLLWLEDTYKKPIVAPVSRAIYDRKYKDTIFKTLTGESLKDLGKKYQASGYRPGVDSPKIK